MNISVYYNSHVVIYEQQHVWHKLAHTMSMKTAEIWVRVGDTVSLINGNKYFPNRSQNHILFERSSKRTIWITFTNCRWRQSKYEKLFTDLFQWFMNKPNKIYTNINIQLRNIQWLKSLYSIALLLLRITNIAGRFDQNLSLSLGRS